MELFADTPIITVEDEVAARVRADIPAMRRPTRLRAPGNQSWQEVHVVNSWVVETEWWRPPGINRAYYEVLTADDTALYEIFYDRLTSAWHLSRHYD
ncbi:MAG TPA: hypothetical protein VN193_02945 [Candidatus Angelobacter sp.]|jgi:hypothetical protein|nr:hypothetical protein [Candidatus Angelobacter sp.]